MTATAGLSSDGPYGEERTAALDRAESLGCRNAEVRVERIHTQYVSLRDGKLETNADDIEVGIGIRVVHNGSMGFAATVDIDPRAAAALADLAVEAAKLTAKANRGAVELADEPGHGVVAWTSPFRTDPTTVSLADKVERLSDLSGRLLGDTGVDHVSARLSCTAEEKFYADLAGTWATQRRVRIHPVIEALALSDSGSFETMRTLMPPAGRGYEYFEGEGWDIDGEIDVLSDLLAEKLRSPSVEPGDYDLVIDPTNLWLTIHESVGHTTELDRALGYEAAYAGTSFATRDKLGSLRYGSALMNVTADRTTPYGLATIGYDDEGVEAQRFDLVREGLFVGYQLDRKIAAEAGFGRSNGCSFASSPLMMPIQRMANVSLAPAPASGPSTEDLISSVDRGIYVVGDKSWSIDMQRYNFQFTGQRFFAIKGGRIVGQVRDAAYQATTTEFWNSLVGLGGMSTYVLGGATNCGKGQPGQSAPVSHGCPSARFDHVRILNAREESGRQ